MNWQLPKEIQGDRFGVTHFHHPELLQALEESAPEMKLLALIDELFQAGNLDVAKGYLGTAEKLQGTLLLLYDFEARKLFNWQGAIGTYLGRLGKKFPKRVEQKRGGQRLWRINPP
jgi:hypothetical protein